MKSQILMLSQVLLDVSLKIQPLGESLLKREQNRQNLHWIPNRTQPMTLEILLRLTLLLLATGLCLGEDVRLTHLRDRLQKCLWQQIQRLKDTRR